MSKAKPCRMPSRFWISTAVAGKVLSGVEVASTIRSMSSGVRPALASAARAARLAQRRRRLVVGRDVALADAGALDDPLVGGLDHAFEIGILHDAARQRRANAAHD